MKLLYLNSTVESASLDDDNNENVKNVNENPLVDCKVHRASSCVHLV